MAGQVGYVRPQVACRGKAVTISGRNGALLAVLFAGSMAGCATPEARDIGGRWVPLNRFAETPQPIPLRHAYLYQATPADGTLKSMLERWARDVGRVLSYEHDYDYTLHARVADIRTHDLAAATAALTSAYVGQGIKIFMDDGRIVVALARGMPIASLDELQSD